MTHTSNEILFDKFETIECLKKDAHQSVYIATHIYLGKKIILKTLDTENQSDKTVLERFKREAKILAKLDHPNLVKVLDFGTFKNFFYISFEYFESKNLRDVINQNILTDEDKKYIIIQLFKALNIAHQNFVIHRDIKPENILLNDEYQLRIADFGLAMVSTESKITQDSSIVGTPSYMSPEQLRGEKTYHTDLFSAGIVAYELYTGKNPFSGNSVSETVNKILNYNESSNYFDYQILPEDVRPAIKSLLRKKVNDRAKSALEVLGMLGIEGDKYEPVRTGNVSIIRSPFRYHYAVIIILIILIITAYVYNKGLLRGYDSVFFNHKPTDVTNLVPKDSASSAYQITRQVPEPVIKKNEPKVTEGRLFIECQPWADVYIDGQKIDTTPLKDYLLLKFGSHKLKLVHPTFPEYEKDIFISSDKITSVSFNFYDVIGFLNCNVYPWGEVFINNESRGVTPFRNAIALFPGKYDIVVKNPQYGEVDDQVTITSKDTVNYNLNFDTTNKLLKKALN
jgi:serine/threonine protein kinase